MKKRLIALLAASSMILSCGSVAFADGEAEPIKELNNYVTDATYLTPNTILKGTNSIHLQITANYIEGYTEMDCNSQMLPAAASEYYTEDNGVTWTFKLKEGLKWVNCEGEEMADYKAEDFITGLEVVLNYWKNDTANTLIPKNTIVGAEDYYEWTKAMDEEEAMELDTTKFLEMVGIEAPDDQTVIYHCTTNVPYFVSATASPSFYPISQGLIDACGGYAEVEAAEWTDLWYSGPYYISDFLAGNFLELSPNPLYWDTESTRFDKVTYLVVSDNTLAYSLYENGEIDRVQLPTATLKDIYENEDNEYHDQLVQTRQQPYSFSVHFNYTKLNEDGTMDEQWNKAIANEAFRKALYHGVNWIPYLQTVNFIDPLAVDLDTYTVPGLTSFSDGTDYTERVKELTGVEANDDGTPAKYDAELAAQYKAQAIEELTAQGVTFPIEMVYHVQGGNQSSEDKGYIMKQMFEGDLGTDFVTMELDTYVTSWTGEIIGNKLQCIAIVGMDAYVADVNDFLGAEVANDPASMFGTGWSHVNDIEDEELYNLYQEFTTMVNDAKAISDNMDNRNEAYAQAEAFLINHALFIPIHYRNFWELSHINDYSMPYAGYGCLGGRWKNVETSVEPYTTEDYAEFKAEYLEAISK